MTSIHTAAQLLFTSHRESTDGTLDPERAHKAADDPSYNTEVATCGLCQATRLAKDEEKKAQEEALGANA